MDRASAWLGVGATGASASVSDSDSEWDSEPRPSKAWPSTSLRPADSDFESSSSSELLSVSDGADFGGEGVWCVLDDGPAALAVLLASGAGVVDDVAVPGAPACSFDMNLLQAPPKMRSTVAVAVSEGLVSEVLTGRVSKSDCFLDWVGGPTLTLGSAESFLPIEDAKWTVGSDGEKERR